MRGGTSRSSPSASASESSPRRSAGPVTPGEEGGAEPSARIGFRALVWDGQLLATGMQMIDGVAVFTPEQIGEIKRLVTWAVPA
jgi:hypothetical protein